MSVLFWYLLLELIDSLVSTGKGAIEKEIILFDDIHSNHIFKILQNYAIWIKRKKKTGTNFIFQKQPLSI